MVSDRNAPHDAALRVRLNALDNIRLCAEAVSDGLTKTPGGDAFDYFGGMNPVEDLLEALDDYEKLFETHNGAAKP